MAIEHIKEGELGGSVLHKLNQTIDEANRVHELDDIKEVLNKQGLFVTNVTPATAEKNVSITYQDFPNDSAVKSILTDDTRVLVTIEWDRREFYQELPTINGIEVTSYSQKIAGTYIQTIEIPLEGNGDIVCELNNSTYTVEVVEDTPPEVENITFGDYPIGQTSLKAGDLVDVTITANQEFNTVVVTNFELGTSREYTVELGLERSIQVPAPSRGLTEATEQRIRLSVKSSSGSISEVFTSVGGMLVNNAVPSLTVSSVSYPGSQSALKDAEEAIITYSTSNTDTVVPSLHSDLELVSHVGNVVTVKRLSGNYVLNSNNVSFGLTLTENGATKIVTTSVDIAHTHATVTNSDWVQVRSGIPPVTINTSFDQIVEVLSLSVPPNRGTLTTNVTGVEANTFQAKISAEDSDIHNNINVPMSLEVRNKAGKVTTIERNYRIKGFGRKTLTLVYPEFISSIGTNVVTESSVALSGLIQSDPPFAIGVEKVNEPGDLTLASQWCFTDASLSTIQIASAVEDFGYEPGTNIEILIEEI